MVHDVNALRGMLGCPDESMFTTLWPDDVTYPTITTVLAYRGGPRVVFTWSYLTELRDYFEETGVYWRLITSADPVSLPFSETLPHAG